MSWKARNRLVDRSSDADGDLNMVAHYIPEFFSSSKAWMPEEDAAQPFRRPHPGGVAMAALPTSTTGEENMALEGRPFLRYMPVPLPVVTTSEEWKAQLKDMVKRRVWPKRWQPKAMEYMSLVHLNEAKVLRQRMGLEEAFMEDEAVMFGVKALKKPTRARQQAALVQATHQAIAELDGRKEDLAQELLGPRGGMPRTKGDLVKLAVLLNVVVDPKDTIEQLKVKITSR